MDDENSIIEELRDGYDWKEVFGYAGEEGACGWGSPSKVANASDDLSTAPFSRADVVALKHWTEGENDGPPWRVCGWLRDGRWFYLEAGCDYTGWDCQASGWACVADDWESLLQFGLTQEARALWGL